MSIAESRAELLNKLPMVQWDRCVEWDGNLVAYGWIGRNDQHLDFVTLAFLWPDDPTTAMVVTSSNEHSEKITELLYGAGGSHTPCKRVRDQLPGVQRTVDW